MRGTPARCVPECAASVLDRFYLSWPHRTRDQVVHRQQKSGAGCDLQGTRDEGAAVRQSFRLGLNFGESGSSSLGTPFPAGITSGSANEAVFSFASTVTG